jgi:hypothetical protein
MTSVAPKYSFPAKGYRPIPGTDATSWPRVAPVAVTLQPTGGPVDVVLNSMPPGQQLSSIATLFIDNSQGPLPLTVSFADTEMTLAVQAYTQGYYPVFTSGLIFTVAAPLIAEYGGAVTVKIQAMNFEVGPLQTTAALPNLNAGARISVGLDTGWTTYAFTVPGTGSIYTALEIDNAAYSSAVTVSGVDLTGAAWSVTQPGFVTGELVIPPTLAGSAATATTPLTAAGAETLAIIPLRWRIEPAGIATTSSKPGSFTPGAISFLNPPEGATVIAFALPAGDGAFVSAVGFTSAGLSQVWSLAVIDQSGATPADIVLYEGNFAAGVPVNVTAAPIGAQTVWRGGNLQVVLVVGGGAAVGAVVGSLYYATDAASQNG